MAGGLALLLLAFSGGPVMANLIIEQSYLTDPTGRLTFDQVRERTFTPYSGILTKGYTTATTWIRLTVAAPPTSANGRQEVVAVRIRPPYLDDIRLYDPEVTQGVATTGDKSPWREQEFQSINHGFILGHVTRSRDVWLRVQSSSNTVVGVDALPLTKMDAAETRQAYVNAFDLVLMLFLLVWGLMLMALRPDKLVSAFVVVQLISVLYSAAYFGLFRIHLGNRLPDDLTDILFSTLIILAPCVYLLFYRRLLAEYSPPRWMLKVLLAFQYYPLVGFTLMQVGHTQWALQLNAVLILLSFGWLMIVVATVVRQQGLFSDLGTIPMPFMVVGSTLFVVGLYTVILPALGLVQASDASLYRSIFQSLFSGVLLSLMVYVHTRRQEQAKMQAFARAAEEVRFERWRREEQSKFLAMLTHEIRTPLTVMSYAAETPMSRAELGHHVNQGVREIDEIIERCSQVDRLEQNAYRLETRGHSLPDLVTASIDRTKPNQRLTVESVPNITIQTDAALFGVILHNLFDNALKYSKPGSPVHVTFQVEPDKGVQGLTMIVRNTLGDFALPDPQRLFDKYYRSPTAHAATGSGLGLYLVKAFVEMLQGRIQYQPQKDEVSFKLWLPL